MLLGAASVARALRLWGLVTKLVESAALLPATRPAPPLDAYYPAHGAERGRVGLLAGCVAGALFADTTAAAVAVLQRNGVSVVVPPGQGCCGALHLHAGAPEEARALARRNLDAFPAELDAIVVTAAGCGASMKEYGELLGADASSAPRAVRFAARVRDITEYLAALPIAPPSAPLPLRVTYHDACHLAHAQGVREPPRRLLAGIPGLELIELAESDVCCGSAGSYNLTEPEMARRLRERKVDRIAATGAEVVAAANPGCALQIRAGLLARGLDVRVAHPVELLAEAYRQEPARGA
jgi:glycolate oxidase iron-sulfur subunit